MAAPVLARVRDRALPQCCLLCGDACPQALCDACAGSLPRVGADACPRCQLDSVHGQVCGRCLKRPPQWQRLLAPWRYTFPFDAAILAAKYQRALPVFRWAAQQAFAASPWPFAAGVTLLPVPLAPARLQSRGYNQARLIAQEIARQWAYSRSGAGDAAADVDDKSAHVDDDSAHVDDDSVVRIRETDVQQRLNWAERRRNVSGAFAATRSFAGESVLLVDDVLTTGATLNELARVVLAAGATRVDALVLARVQPLRRRERIAKFGRAVA